MHPARRAVLGRETYAELKAAALSQNDLLDGPPATSGDGAENESLDCDCTD